MPAKHLYRIDREKAYSHIYNKGVENRIIFADNQDYEVFQGYLRDYLTAPREPESTKKTFKVNGRTFRGIPHQPKNYLDKVELIAYSLLPNHFHLLLHQKTRGSLESFIRSLCTRYSMYFNKKYQRTGALFEGPYKSIQIEDKTRLLLLTRHIHHAANFSSYPEYLGTKVTSWVKPKVVQSFLDKAKTDLFKGVANYKEFVEKYELDQKSEELLEGIIIESEAQHLERRGPARNAETYPKQSLSEPNLITKTHTHQNLEPLLKLPAFLGVTVSIFLVLLTLGVRNITTTKAINPNAPITLGVSEEEEDETLKEEIETATKEAETVEITLDEAKFKRIKIKIDDGAASVNIR